MTTTRPVALVTGASSGIGMTFLALDVTSDESVGGFVPNPFGRSVRKLNRMAG
ncbi:hypothetical protein [Amycolatopsis sp. YIM 10]|uniref:hypothetical protein n=1 Tax=Amycolatopsis sp. YIM 10 TaxID=2653857 RepID=UPI0012A7F86D|nr:hypothetical protein [Amycolatopsis sp. YIM 10]QFU91812.1 hypothetical protein YIM_33255 [Amycolatopsis sp. YIM 10]